MPAPVSLVLASVSPRRRALLAGAGYTVMVWPSGVDERRLEIPAGGAATARAGAEQVTLTAARAKARAVAGRISQGLVLGADTVVELNGEVLGKPAGREQARGMLARLSGTTHRVVSAVVLIHAATGRRVETVCASLVTMRTMSPEQIEAYVASGAGDGKAGGLDIRHGGGRFIARIEGSESNVEGLPLEVLPTLIADLTPARRSRG